VTRNILRGEFVRLFLTDQTNQYIAQATNASIHLSLSLEDATTKDTQSVAGTSTEYLSYKSQEPTTINFDISSDCIYQGGLHSLTEGTTYPFKFAYATGANQQTMGDVIEQGDAMLTTLTANAPVGQNVTYNGSFTGVGLPGGTGSNSNEGNL
jgi:hypothetical protein